MQGPARQTEEGIPSVVVLVNDEACSQGSKDEADGSGHGVAEGRCDQARARRQQSQNCVDADVTILARGDEGAEKAGPEHEMTDQRIPPQPRDVEEVSQQDLGKGQDQKGTDEHDEDGVLLSDVFTDPIRRKKMVDKRHRKMSTILRDLPTPMLEGPADAETTLLGWGSTWGVIKEAAERLTAGGVSVNHLQIKTIVPLHGDEITAVLEKSQRLIIIENNQSGQFARHLRAETGIEAHGHIRKYDGEPFEPKHIVSAVNDIIGGQEVVDVLSTEPGWRTDHPTGTSGPWEGLNQVKKPGVTIKA